jgi:hypothetical protein
MSLFTQIPGTVVLGCKGTYTESSLFELESQVYAKHGRNYIRLRQNGHTSKDRIFWKTIDLSVPVQFPLGNMTVSVEKLEAAE